MGMPSLSLSLSLVSHSLLSLPSGVATEASDAVPSSWTEHLDQHVAANGFEVMTNEVVTFRDTYRHAWAMSTLAGIEDIRCKVDSDKAVQLQKLLGNVSDEVDQGVGMESPWTLVVARKV